MDPGHKARDDRVRLVSNDEKASLTVWRKFTAVYAALLSWLLMWSREIRVGAGLLVLLFGVSRLFQRRHPRWLTRVRPSQLLLWSLLMATAHGAALMLLPFVMGLCETPAAPAGRAPGVFEHESMMLLMRSNVATAVVVSLLHSAAMVGSDWSRRGSSTAMSVCAHCGPPG